MKENYLKQTKQTKQNVAQKSEKCSHGAQKSEHDISQVLVDEIKAYNRAHNRLILRLIASSDEPTFILATLHAIHAISMKYEQDTVCKLLRTRKASNGKK